MAKDSRSNWALFSGMTRVEQRALVFLIGLIAAGLAWQEWQGGGPQRSDFVVQRGAVSSGPNAKAGVEPVSEPSGPVDLNKADAKTLAERLAGIGSVKADAIVRYRKSHGPFQRLEDLDAVPGIGSGTIESIRDRVAPLATTPTATVPPDSAGTPLGLEPSEPVTPAAEEPSPVDINTAGPKELDTLQGVGAVLAQRIVEYRRTHGPFRRIEDLQEVKGIGPVVIRENRDRLVVGPVGAGGR
jgi:competence protein ComEA